VRYLVKGLGIVACGLVVMAFVTTPGNQLSAYAFNRTVAIAGAASALAVITVGITAVLALRRAGGVREVKSVLVSLAFAAVVLVGSAVVLGRLLGRPNGN
jgi:uncharacterized membrane protein YfcA